MGLETEPSGKVDGLRWGEGRLRRDEKLGVWGPHLLPSDINTTLVKTAPETERLLTLRKGGRKDESLLCDPCLSKAVLLSRNSPDKPRARSGAARSGSVRHLPGRAAAHIRHRPSAGSLGGPTSPSPSPVL